MNSMRYRFVECFLAAVCLAGTIDGRGEDERKTKAAASVGEQAISHGGLELSAVRSGWGKVQAHKSVGGKEISIGGRKFVRGIGMHANGDMALVLDGEATSFHAFVGVDDEVTPQVGSLEFTVLDDAKEVWKSGV